MAGMALIGFKVDLDVEKSEMSSTQARHETDFAGISGWNG